MKTQKHGFIPVFGSYQFGGNAWSTHSPSSASNTLFSVIDVGHYHIYLKLLMLTNHQPSRDVWLAYDPSLEMSFSWTLDVGWISLLTSGFAWHVEDHDLHNLNHLHMGTGKTRYGIDKVGKLLECDFEKSKCHSLNGIM